jgi:hypothetical protein
MEVVVEHGEVHSEKQLEMVVDSASDTKGFAVVPPAIPTPAAEKEASDVIGAKAPAQPEFAAVQEAVLLVMDESIALSLSMESAAAPVEKQLAGDVRDAVSTVLAHIGSTPGTSAEKIAALRACLKVLIQVLLNAKVMIISRCPTALNELCSKFLY